jgi:hypothetical protein
LLALSTGIAVAGAARAQHPIGPVARPLPARLAAADAAALATVREVDVGRIRVDAATALWGTLPPEFHVKRAPAAAPPLAVGDRALLLLRGARPPYVLVDRPDETIRLADAEAEAAWADAVRGWIRVREQPAAWVPLFVAWLERGPDTLRDLAAQSLADPSGPYQPIPARVYADLASAAWNPSLAPGARHAAARVASLHEEGRERLAEGLLAAPRDCDPGVAQAALRTAPYATPERATALLLRGLDHTDTEVRRAALQSVQLLRGTPAPALRERVARLAREDGESWLRAQAERTLAPH